MQTRHVRRIVNEELPFLALEKAMMWLSEDGVDRQVLSESSETLQQAHAKIRETALTAKKSQEEGKAVTAADLLQDPFFEKVLSRPSLGCLRSDPVCLSW